MSYATVVSRIDLELDRLRAARAVLLSPSGLPPVSPILPSPSFATLPAAADVPERVPEVRVKRAYRKRSPEEREAAAQGRLVRNKAAAPPRALSGIIPAGPVAVSAERLADTRRAVELPRGVREQLAAPPEGSLEAMVRELQARSGQAGMPHPGVGTGQS